MHCTLLLQVMRKHRMGHLLDRLPPHLPHETRFSSGMQSRARTESDPGVPSAVSPTKGVDPPPQSAMPAAPPPPRHVLKKSASAYRGPSDTTSCGTGTEFRDLLMKTILATDMSVHFKWMPKIDSLRKKVERTGDSEEVDSQTRLLLCQTLIKCADISNSVRYSCPASRPIPHIFPRHMDRAVRPRYASTGHGPYLLSGRNRPSSSGSLRCPSRSTHRMILWRRRRARSISSKPFAFHCWRLRTLSFRVSHIHRQPTMKLDLRHRNVHFYTAM